MSFVLANGGVPILKRCSYSAAFAQARCGDRLPWPAHSSVTHPMIADIKKELGRLPLMSSRESTRVKTRKYLFQIDGGAVDFFKTRPPSERGGGLSLQNLYFFLQNQGIIRHGKKRP